MNMQSSQKTPTLSSSNISTAYDTACRFIAPLFDLRDMVAVNPFMGFLDQDFSSAALTIESLFHEAIVPGVSQNREATGPRTLCVADRLALESVATADAPFKALTRFLASRYDEESAAPFQEQTLYRAYHEYAAVDRSVDTHGLKGYREQFATLPAHEGAARQFLFTELCCPQEELSLYLGRLLARLKGFAGFLRAKSYDGGADTLGELPQLLTILLAQDWVLARLEAQSFGPQVIPAHPGYARAFEHRLAQLEAAEEGLAQNIEAKLSVEPAKGERALAQAVFCIDVRSERYRRHLEQQGNIETYGFAGFFGMAMQVSENDQSRPHCPPLLNPGFAVSPFSFAPAASASFKKAFKRSLNAPLSSLGHVEAWGMTYAWKLLKEAFPNTSQLAEPRKMVTDLSHIPLATRTEMARAVLKNMGLRAPLAPLVVLVGHDSKATNNLQEASLACGACAGHSGGPNAQVAAALLNCALVREQLKGSTQEVSADVVFLAAIHETVSDTLQFVNEAELSHTQQEAFLLFKRHCRAASVASQRERAPVVLGKEESQAQAFLRRAHDYAETQTEWGLAGNAAFIVGSRALSQTADLKGRAFLHSYDESRDEDASILEMILTAPAVVGSWINLQYYASTVAPRSFGCGRKTLHNLCGSSGVLEGGQGDLAVGLSRESLTFGTQDGSAHAPLRLHLMIQADASKVCGIISRHASLRNLVKGRWIRVSTIEVQHGKAKLRPLTSQMLEEFSKAPLAAE